MISISPTQKVGSEKPRIEPAMIVLAGIESGLSPAHSPSGMPSTIAISIAASASSSVAGMRSRISCDRRHVERERAAEVAVQRACRGRSRYCSHSGLSRPERRGRARDLRLVGLRVDQDVDRVADRVDAEEHEQRHDEHDDERFDQRAG